MVDDMTIEGALLALENAESDVRGDFGEEGLEAGYHDVVAAVATQFPQEVAVELCRRTLGYTPGDVRRTFNLADTEFEDEEW